MRDDMIVDVTEEWDNYGKVSGQSIRDQYTVEITAELSDGELVVGEGDADSRGVARAQAWSSIMSRLTVPA